MFEGNIFKAGIVEEFVVDEMVCKVYFGKNFEFWRKVIDFNEEC